MMITPRSGSIGPACAVALVAAACAMLTLPGCGSPQQDVGTIDISASKKAAAENGIAGPGERGPDRGGRASD